jgi:hypothetical protein
MTKDELSSKSEKHLVVLRKKILNGNCSYLAEKILKLLPTTAGRMQD